MKQEYHVTVQRKKTGTYGEKQYYQRYMAFPKELCNLYDLEEGQIVRLLINGTGEINLKKVESKPLNKPMKYEEWLAKINPHIPTTGPGKTYTQICNDAGLTMRAAPAEWVHKAQIEIRLNKARDKQTRHIVWTRAVLPDGKDQKQKEGKVRDRTLGEF
jgi:bifunctional DNA-binding transcriptional regulator/antitoxin component of YhaV-PrlF toxin-antitoxin module